MLYDKTDSDGNLEWSKNCGELSVILPAMLPNRLMVDILLPDTQSLLGGAELKVQRAPVS